MSRPRHEWWGYVMNIVRLYPKRSNQHALALEQKITPSYSGQTGGGSSSRKTEDTVVHAMSRKETKQYESVHLAIRETELKQNGDIRLQLIRMMYWDRSHTMGGAATALHISYRTARRWHSQFIYLVAENYGLLD